MEKLHSTSKHNSKFAHNHGAHKGKGHHGLMKHSGKTGGKFDKGGHLMVSPSNVKALGSKGKG